MNISTLKHLTSEEANLVMETPAIVAFLIGGADNNFDEKEKEQAGKIVAFRKTTGDPLLFDYFTEIELTFENVLQVITERYAGNAEERNIAIINELEQLNAILPKIDHNYATALVTNWRSFAHGIAEASGGFLGLFVESSAEAKLVGLSMITYS